MQSEMPTSKRHWSQSQTQSTPPTAPLHPDYIPDTATMKTVTDAQQEAGDSSQETSILTGSDETDRLPPPPLPSAAASPGTPPPLESEALAGDSKEIFSNIPVPESYQDPPGSHEDGNGTSSHQENLTTLDLQDADGPKTKAIPQNTPTLSIEDIPPPITDPEGVDVVSGYDNVSYDHDHPPPPITTLHPPDPNSLTASINPDMLSPTTNGPVRQPPTPNSSPTPDSHQQSSPTKNINQDRQKPSKDNSSFHCGDSQQHTTEIDVGLSPETHKNDPGQTEPPSARLDTPEYGESNAGDGSVPNDSAKMDDLQEKTGYDNKAFSGDESAKSEEQKETSIHGSPKEPRVASDEKVSDVLPEGSPIPPRVPRRVSFSERPPQRAVYDNGNTTAAPPVDPAARAVKEQGLGPGEKWRVLRNVTIISAAFMVLFTAFFGAANLQSSVNPSEGLGTVSLTAVYAALIVSNLFLPSMVIRRLGCKWTVALGMILFSPYAAAQLRATWASLVPTALLVGIAGAPMWCAKCSYLNAAAGAYSAVTGSPRDLVMVRFFALFYVLFPLGHVWGNLITSGVLSTGEANNRSALSAVDVAALCGANFCPAARSPEENPNLERPPDHLITLIAALFVALSAIAALMVAFGVDNLRRYGERLGDAEGGAGVGDSPGGGAALLVATVRLLGDKKQLFLVPITAFIGISQAFLGADFTESYIACAWGIPYIGYALMGYGLASSLASVAVSWAVKRFGRLPVVCASIVLFLALVGVLRWWTPRPGQGAAFVLLAAAWGLADSTALVINAMYGLLFRGREAAAYSNFSLWGSAGFIVTYSYSPHLCAVTKLAILAVVLVLSLIGFVLAERALRRILAAEEEAKKREESLAESGISVINDKAHAA